MQQNAIGWRRAALYRQAALYIVLFVLAAALVTVLWIFTDTTVAAVFTCLGVLFAGAEALTFGMALLGTVRMASARASAQYSQAILLREGRALFFNAEESAVAAAARQFAKAECAKTRRERRAAKAKAKRLAAALGRPVRIHNFAAGDLTELTGKTLHMSSACRAAGAARDPQAWSAAEQSNAFRVYERGADL